MSHATSREFASQMQSTLLRLGISQRAAARRSGMSDSFISNMCMGHLPPASTLLNFCHRLEIDPQPLLQVAGYAETMPVDEYESSAVTLRPLLEEIPLSPWRADTMNTGLSYAIPPCHHAVTDFCLQIQDDTMWPALRPGDIVGIQACALPEAERLMLVGDGTQGLLRALHRARQGWMLMPHNPLYPPTPARFAKGAWQVIGRVSWSLRDWMGE